jgi:hypothetical protein
VWGKGANGFVLEPPHAGDEAVHEERLLHVGVRAEDGGAVVVGQQRAAVEQGVVPLRQEAHRRWSIGGRDRASRHVVELTALLVAEAPKPVERVRKVANPHPRPVRDLGPRRRPEGRQVPPHELAAGSFRIDLRIFDRDEEGSLRRFPQAALGRVNDAALEPERIPDTVRPLDVHPVLALEPLGDLGAGARLGGEFPEGHDQARCGLLRCRRDPPRGRDIERGAEQRVVGGREQVHGASHQHATKDDLSHQRPLQRLAPEALDSCPEADVGCGRPLRLETCDPLERLCHRKPAALEQQLARQCCAVQLPRRENPLHAAVR